MHKLLLSLLAVGVSLGFTGCYVDTVAYESGGHHRAYVDDGYDPGYDTYSPSYAEVIYIDGRPSRFDDRGRLYYVERGHRSYISDAQYARNRRAIDEYRAKAKYAENRGKIQTYQNRQKIDHYRNEQELKQKQQRYAYEQQHKQNQYQQKVVHNSLELQKRQNQNQQKIQEYKNRQAIATYQAEQNKKKKKKKDDHDHD